MFGKTQDFARPLAWRLARLVRLVLVTSGLALLLLACEGIFRRALL